MRWHIGIAATVIACAATAAYAVPSAGAFMGGWVITEAKPAPWSATPAGPPNAELIDKKLIFTRSTLEGPAPFACTKANFWSEPMPAQNLFSGNLTEVEKQARDLGFTSRRIVILSVSCLNTETAVPDFALVDEHTAMFAIGDYIYVMKR